MLYLFKKSNDDHHADNNIDDDLPVENILLNLDATVAEISTNFAGAPETVLLLLFTLLNKQN